MAKCRAHRIFLQGFFQNNPGVGDSACNITLAYDFKMIDFISTSQENHSKHFIMKVTQNCLKIIGYFFAVFYKWSFYEAQACLRLPNSIAAAIVTAFASPMPLIFISSFIDNFPSSVGLFLS